MGDVKGSLEDGHHHRGSSYQTVLPEMAQAQPHWLCLFSSRLPCTGSSKRHTVLLLESEELDSSLSACATIKTLDNFSGPQCSLL